MDPGTHVQASACPRLFRIPDGLFFSIPAAAKRKRPRTIWSYELRSQVQQAGVCKSADVSHRFLFIESLEIRKQDSCELTERADFAS